MFQDQVDVITDAQARLERLDAQLAELVPSWLMAPVVAAYQALRGVSFIVAVTSFLGLVPSERSTGETVKRGGLTLAGNRRARRVLVEGAWSYRYPARVTASPFASGSRACRRRYARSPGRRRPGFAPATAA